MNDKVKNKLDNITTSPGVYLMKDVTGKIIYVGKAKNLKNRVSQYFSNSEKQIKVASMVSNIDDDNSSITSNCEKLLSIDTNASSSGDFTTPLIVGLVIGILIGLIAGVFIMKQKN